VCVYRYYKYVYYVVSRITTYTDVFDIILLRAVLKNVICSDRRSRLSRWWNRKMRCIWLFIHNSTFPGNRGLHFSIRAVLETFSGNILTPYSRDVTAWYIVYNSTYTYTHIVIELTVGHGANKNVSAHNNNNNNISILCFPWAYTNRPPRVMDFQKHNIINIYSRGHFEYLMIMIYRRYTTIGIECVLTAIVAVPAPSCNNIFIVVAYTLGISTYK